MLENGVSGSWYALHTRRQHEKVAAQILRNKGYEILLPLYIARHKWSDRIKRITLPLFPGYLFVREWHGRWLQILTTPGVCGIVGCAGRPVAIPYAEIEAVRRIVESSLSVEPHPLLKQGDSVRIKCGPLAGLQGILIRKDKLTRLVISVEMLGQSAAVDVDVATVERIVRNRTLCELEGKFDAWRPNGQTLASPATNRLNFGER